MHIAIAVICDKMFIEFEKRLLLEGTTYRRGLHIAIYIIIEIVTHKKKYREKQITSKISSLGLCQLTYSPIQKT